MRCNKLAALLVLVLVGSACRAEVAAVKTSDEVQAIATGSNEFATDLYARLRSDKPTNLFFSPYSVSIALAMTCAGAKGETEQQMASVLHVSPPGPHAIRPSTPSASS